MGSVEAHTEITVENSLTTGQIMRSRFSDFEVQDILIDDDCDRLLIGQIMTRLCGSTSALKAQKWLVMYSAAHVYFFISAPGYRHLTSQPRSATGSNRNE